MRRSVNAIERLRAADTYVFGKPGTKYAVTRRANGKTEWSLPWRKPNGGWKVGRFIVWWAT